MIILGVRACAAGCVQDGYHLVPDCVDPDCRGCLPWLADGRSLVCRACRDRAAGWLTALPDLWVDLAERPRTSGLASYGGNGGDPEACPDCDTGRPCTRQHRSAPTPLGERQVEARSLIRETLTAWCRHLHVAHTVTLPDETKIVATSRRLAADASVQAAAYRIGAQILAQPGWDPSLRRDLPAHGSDAIQAHKVEEHRLTRVAETIRGDRETGRDIIAALVDHLSRHLDVLLADPLAGEKLVEDLAVAVREGRACANPSRRMGVRVRCDCGTFLPVRDQHTTDGDALACPDCGTAGTLSWWMDRHLAAVEAMPLADIPGWLAGHGIKVTERQVRAWADRGALTPCGGRGRGRGRVRRFEAAAVLVTARQLLGLDLVPVPRGAVD